MTVAIIVGSLSLVALIVATSMLAKMFPTPNVWRPEAERLLSEADRKYFSGLYVAVDTETREIVSAASSAASIRADLKRLRPERVCRVVRVPGTPRESLRLLLDVGPCVSVEEYQCADGE